MTNLLHTSKSFAGYDYPLEEADVCVLGVPFDSTASAAGNQRFGPWTIRYCLQSHIPNYYIPKTGKEMMSKICDLGNLNVVHGNFDETDKLLRETVEDIKKANPDVFPVFIGGEHSMSLPIVRALKPDTIVNIDAHSDMWDDQWGQKYAHSTWLYHAQEELGCNVVQIGLREWNKDHEKIFKTHKFFKTLKGCKGRVYISIDIDGFDPAYAPATGFPVPEGLTPTEVFDVIDKVFAKHNVIGMDVMEVNSHELNDVTSNLAARTIIRALSHLK